MALARGHSSSYRSTDMQEQLGRQWKTAGRRGLAETHGAAEVTTSVQARAQEEARRKRTEIPEQIKDTGKFSLAQRRHPESRGKMSF